MYFLRGIAYLTMGLWRTLDGCFQTGWMEVQSTAKLSYVNDMCMVFRIL